MPYEGPRLAALFDRAEEDAFNDLAHKLADQGGELMTRRIKELTPVGHQPFESGYVPGHLRESIVQKLTVFRPGRSGWVHESGTETYVDYAPFVEHGTGLWGPRRMMYEIRPKNPEGWLRFHTREGRLVFAKRVWHPGSPGNHFFLNGTELAREELPALFEKLGREWEAERAAAWAVKGRTQRIRS